MKHNLPQPSQAWGSDVDRRIAYLENDMTLMKSKVGNSYDAVNALVASRATNGVAQPFYQELRINRPGPRDGIGTYEDLWEVPLDWGRAGSFMQLSISGYIYLPVRDLNLNNYNQPRLSVGVRDSHRTYMRRLDSHANTIVERWNNQSHYALSGSLSLSMVVDFDNFQYGSVFVGLEGLPDQPSYINNHNDRAYLSVQLSGVRY